jgi:integrase/recombinase XerD
MSIDVVSPLRQRMIEDMAARKLSAGTQRLHISSCRRFAAFLRRSPETATVEDVRRFQLHLAETGTSIPNRNRLMTGLRFLFRVTLGRLDLAAEIYHLRELQKIPQVISPDEARRLLAVANSLRTRLSKGPTPIIRVTAALGVSNTNEGRPPHAGTPAKSDQARRRM